MIDKEPLATAIDSILHDQYNTLSWFVADPLSALEVYKNPNCYVVLDFETNGKEYGSALCPDNHIILACWEVHYGDGTFERKHVWGDEYSLWELERDIELAQFVVAHNAKFELQWLKRCGLDLRKILVFDTYLAEWVIAGNRGGTPGWELNLDATAERYGLPPKLDLAKRMIDMGIDPEDIPREWLEPYCYRDVEICRSLYQQQIKRLVQDGLLHLALTRNLTAAALADIEFNGAELDEGRVEQEYTNTLAEFRECDNALHQMAGNINLSSPKQLGELLFGTLGFPIPRDHKGNKLETKKGLPKTDVKTLDKLKATTPEQQEFLRLYKKRNRLDSLLTKNLEFFRLVCEQRAGRFLGNINQGFTKTHRLASTGRPILFDGIKGARGVQFQNLPRIYKKLFTAHKDGWFCLEFDAAQLEFRVAAEMGHDPVAEQAIVNGEDVHADTAKVFVDWNTNHPNNRHEDFAGLLTYKEARQPAKPQTFKPLYGGQGQHDAEREYCKFFREKYKGIAATQKEWTMEVLDSGKLRTPYGMLFHWPGTKMSRFGYVDNTTSIYNFPVQGFATAEIIPIALVYFWHLIRDMAIEIFNTIHDSICARVQEDTIDVAKMIAKHCMTTAVYRFLESVYNYEFYIPLGVGLKVAKNWGDTKVEEVYAVWRDGRETYKKKED